LDGEKWEERFELREERKMNEWLFVIGYELHMKVRAIFLSLSKWCVMVVVDEYCEFTCITGTWRSKVAYV
jgi:hypothetical protein